MSRVERRAGWNGSLDKLQKALAGASAAEGQPCAEPGSFCWNEFMAADVNGAANFYTRLFGWKTEAMPGMDYTLFKHDGKTVGGLMGRKHDQAPPTWLAYVAVEDVDASARKAEQLGAKLCLPPTDIPTVGRIAIFQDPQGASLGLFQPART